jgi:methoxymalonate biosynthesis protein
VTAEDIAGHFALVDEFIGDRAQAWDETGLLPVEVLRKLGAAGLLCAQIPPRYGGLGLTSLQNGELTASVGARCGSVRSIMTSHGMAAWTIQRLGDASQHGAYLAALTSGGLAAVGFSEPAAGSDLSAMRTRISGAGDSIVIDGHKVWVTGARYADYLVIFGRYGQDAAAVVVRADAPGVRVEPIPDPLGCRAAGHASVWLEGVRLPAASLLGGGQDLALLVPTALAYGRLSVAWGCVGLLRGCLRAAAGHAKTREQFGAPIGQHQLVARHLAELLTAEQVATRCCEHASRCWDAGSPEAVVAAVLAKYVSADRAAAGAAVALQVMASAGARAGHVVARAYRDAKLMEIIEGTSEICQLLLAEHVLTAPA